MNTLVFFITIFFYHWFLIFVGFKFGKWREQIFNKYSKKPEVVKLTTWQEEYTKQQEEFEKKHPVGTRVKIVRKVLSTERGCGWVISMNSTVGKEGTITDYSNAGVRVNTIGASWNYSFFILEPIEKSETKTNMIQTISRKALKEIHDVACESWKKKIKAMAPYDPFQNHVELSEEIIKSMFDAASASQKEVLVKYLKEEVEFNASMLKEGEIMYSKTYGYCIADANGGIIWLSNEYGSKGLYVHDLANYKGKKIEKGTQITITA